jgi:hypothetical protein
MEDAFLRMPGIRVEEHPAQRAVSALPVCRDGVYDYPEKCPIPQRKIPDIYRLLRNATRHNQLGLHAISLSVGYVARVLRRAKKYRVLVAVESTL